MDSLAYYKDLANPIMCFLHLNVISYSHRPKNTMKQGSLLGQFGKQRRQAQFKRYTIKPSLIWSFGRKLAMQHGWKVGWRRKENNGRLLLSYLLCIISDLLLIVFILVDYFISNVLGVMEMRDFFLIKQAPT
jgi:hypothetical protein